MASTSLHPSRRRPKTKSARGTPAKKTARVSQKAARPRRAAGAKASARNRTGLTLPKPPPPEQVIAAVREELERLGNRWKNLLPRLKKSVGGRSK
jgi:hypothetical protein